MEFSGTSALAKTINKGLMIKVDFGEVEETPDSKLADAAITARHLLFKVGSDTRPAEFHSPLKIYTKAT